MRSTRRQFNIFLMQSTAYGVVCAMLAPRAHAEGEEDFDETSPLQSTKYDYTLLERYKLDQSTDGSFAEFDRSQDWRNGGVPNLDGRIPGLLWLDPMQAAVSDISTHGTLCMT